VKLLLEESQLVLGRRVKVSFVAPYVRWRSTWRSPISSCVIPTIAIAPETIAAGAAIPGTRTGVHADPSAKAVRSGMG